MCRSNYWDGTGWEFQSPEQGGPQPVSPEGAVQGGHSREEWLEVATAARGAPGPVAGCSPSFVAGTKGPPVLPQDILSPISHFTLRS